MKQAQSSRWIGSVLACGAILLGSIWFLFVSRYWSVTRFEIEGIQQLERGEVERATTDALDHGSWKPWDRRNIFFVHTTELEKTLQERLMVERVRVDKKFPNVLRLIIQERQRRILIASDNQYMQVDLNGVVTGEVPDALLAWVHTLFTSKVFADKHHPPVILVSVVSSATSGVQIVDPVVVRQWINVYHSLLASHWRFKTFMLDRVTSRTLKIAVQGDFDVIFDLETPLEPQIATFDSFLRSKPSGMVIHDYINVSVPGKVSFR